jgi:hypothetical protein
MKLLAFAIVSVMVAMGMAYAAPSLILLSRLAR